MTDTASERTGWNIDALPPFEPGATNGTYGMFLTQTTGDMPINRGLTNGDASLVASNGSILDGRNGGTGVNLPAGLANIEANNVDLAAYCSASSPSAQCGSIGARAPPGSEDQVGNDLKIDSGHGDTQHPSTVIVGRVAVEAVDIYLTETDGALNVLLAQALSGNVRLTVREHAGQGDDLNLIHPSDSVFATQNEHAMLIDYSGVANVKRDVTVANAASVLNSPSINALGGWILLRVGDNVTLGASLPLATSDADRLAKNTRVVAGKWIDVYGDSDAPTFPGQLDAGWGTVMHLHGTVTPGTLSAACRDTINPGRECNVTRIFGNVDTDTINFDQTYLGGRTRLYGSNAMTCNAHTVAGCTLPIPTTGGPKTAPAGDSEDFVFVNQLQTMNVAGGHTLMLDLQDGTDSYVVNTTGSQACLGGNQITGATCHNYVINVLDTGAPNRGSDVLVVNGTDAACSGYSDSGSTQCATDDIFLLRRSNYIGSFPAATPLQANEIADNPAFVALLHGNFGTATTVNGITAKFDVCFSAGCQAGQRITAVSDGNPADLGRPLPLPPNGFVVGRRIHVGGSGRGHLGGRLHHRGRSTRSAPTSWSPSRCPRASRSPPSRSRPAMSTCPASTPLGILLGDVTTPDPSGDAAHAEPELRADQLRRGDQRTAQLVNGLSGNDYFASGRQQCLDDAGRRCWATTPSRSARSTVSCPRLPHLQPPARRYLRTRGSQPNDVTALTRDTLARLAQPAGRLRHRSPRPAAG